MKILRTLTIIAFAAISSIAAEPTMTAHFINVGQGAAALLEFPCGAVLIDAGGQDDDSTERLINYLRNFFADRTDLNGTLQAIYITHPHKDHTLALKRVVNGFTSKRFIENGQDSGSGIANVKWVRSVAPQRNITVRQVLNSAVMANGNHNGITDDVIDPIQCAHCDPRITVLSGQWDDDPGWSDTDFDNKNNHSLIIRVDFGDSSFLFDGDLEESGIGNVLTFYRNGSAHASLLHADVYHVGHHGSNNATTRPFLEEITPVIAVISVGRWDYGKGSNSPFTTWAYGHPRTATLDLLAGTIQGQRSDPVFPKAATKSKTFLQRAVRKKIYATAWDGNVKIRATLHKDFTVTRNN